VLAIFAALAGVSEAVGLAALYRGLAVGVVSIVAPATAGCQSSSCSSSPGR
jgi:uncharacterized membrane protein